MSFNFGNPPKKIKLGKDDIHKIKSNPNHICNEDDGRTYAMQALVDGFKDVVYKLLENNKIDISSKDKDGRSLMHYAVMDKNKELIELLLEKGADINLRDKKGKTPINLFFTDKDYYDETSNLAFNNYSKNSNDNTKSSEGGKPELDLEFAEWIIKKGADVNIADSKGNIPLHMAVKYNGISTVSFLLQKTKYVDKSNYTGVKPLHMAAENNFLAVIKKILHYRVDTTATDNRKRNVLHYALNNQDSKVVDFLVLETSAVKMLNEADIENKITPLQQAVAEDKIATVSNMIKHGADINAVDGNGNSSLAIAVDSKLYEMTKMLLSEGADVSGTSVLYNSIYNFDTDRKIFDLLMEYSPNVDATDRDGKTPLMKALKAGRNEIAKTLLDAGADVTKLTNDGKNVMFFVGYSCPKALIKEMIKKGADINQKSKDGNTPLHELVFGYFNEEHLKTMVEEGADVNAVDRYGRVPLHHMLMYEGDAKLAEWIIEKGADINVKTEDNVSILHMVSGTEGAHVSLLEKVIKESNTDINAPDDRGNTPLFYAVQEDCAENVKTLLEYGANPDIENKYGTSPRSLANSYYNRDVRKVFREFDRKKSGNLVNKFNNKKNYKGKENRTKNNNYKPPKSNGGGFIV